MESSLAINEDNDKQSSIAINEKKSEPENGYDLYEETEDDSSKEKPGFFYNGRACWGGLPKWLFIMLIIVAVIGIILAIAIPVGLYVVGPEVTQSGVEDSTMTAQNVRITGWGSELDSLESEMRADYGAMFGALCNETSWATDTDTWMNKTLSDMFKCNSMLGLVPTLMPMAILEVPISELTNKWFGISECSRFAPKHLTITQDVYIAGLPSVTNGQILPTTLDIAYDGKVFGRLALPVMNLETKLEDGTRVVKDVECGLQVTDRHVFLAANMNLFPLVPLVSGQTTWTQQGVLVTEMDMLGTTVVYKALVDNPTIIKDVSYHAGPFATKHHDLWDISIDDPHEMIMCVVGGMLPGLVSSIAAPVPSGAEPTEASSAGGLGAARKRRDGGDGPQYWIPNYYQDARKDAGTGHSKGAASSRSDLPTNVTCPGDENPQGILSNLMKMFGMVDDQETHVNPAAEFTPTPTPIPALDYFVQCNMTKAGDCGFDTMEANPDGKLGYFVYPNAVYGKHTRCGKKLKDGIEAPYGFTVQPGTINRQKVLYYFQGGGACWESVLQDLPVVGSLLGTQALNVFLCSIEANPHNGGVFSDHNTNELNPYYGWTIIQISYCTGDVHGGDAHDDDVKVAIMDLNTHFFRSGYNNTMSTNAWIDENIESTALAPEKFGLGGCSAGALGTQIWEPYLTKKYGLSSANSHIFVESYLGIFPEQEADAVQSKFEFKVSMVQEADTGNVKCYNHTTKANVTSNPTTYVGEVIQDDWGMCELEIMDFEDGDGFKQACDDKTIGVEDWLLSNVKKTKLRRAYVNSKADLVQRMFAAVIYALGGAGTKGAKTEPHGSYVSSMQDLNMPFGGHRLEQVNGTDFCTSVSMADGMCSEMASCFDLNVTESTAKETPVYWEDFALNGYSTFLGKEVPMILIGMLQKIGPLGSFEPIVRDIGVDLLNGLSYWMMGDGFTGEGNYWNRASKVLTDYRSALGKDASWFVTSDQQHCYLPYPQFYEWNVEGKYLHEYLKEFVSSDSAPEPVCANEGCSLPCPIDPLA
ncbi:hypothetical protein SARC_10097 [Sphaeroforma arctica JP610]|uniref:Uncharacterized protein n=1 Tax=Sphaeroforma arctica JP610 TaxID=667725 RepID=A0A0L0FKZ7_9EUKA|nr:hypothetical protein SARC_10097 [Sphaeroforma arctica JP610]KNC77445.1 hypothetical protein SARC_10097 [Sphaeroforma arctica JP610]|eukprot:XP_014151347.1 hypothetical protein SARC_10097 [Sphaeroforma arctica JP610]